MFAPCDASSGVFQPQDDECHMSSISLIFFSRPSPSPVALRMNDGEVGLQQRLCFSQSSISHVPRIGARTHW